MATIIFEELTVNQSFDSNGNNTGVYHFWETEFGLLGRFRASERIGYGDNATWQSFHFRAEGTIAEKMKRMNLKEGSKLFVMGELVPEVFEGKNGPVTRQVVKVNDVRFNSSKNNNRYIPFFEN